MACAALSAAAVMAAPAAARAPPSRAPAAVSGPSDAGSAEDVLGFMRTLLAPFEGESAEVVELQELGDRYGGGRKALNKAVALGVLVPLGEGRYEVPSPSLLRAADALVELGIPVDKG